MSIYDINYIVETTYDGLVWNKATDPACVDDDGMGCDAEFNTLEQAQECVDTLFLYDKYPCRIVDFNSGKILHHFVSSGVIDIVHPPIWLMRLIEERCNKIINKYIIESGIAQ